MWLYHPVWRISCRTCSAWAYDSRGDLKRDPGTGEPYERGENQATPCASCPKVPRWAKAAGKRWSELRGLAHELSPQHRMTIEAYYRFKAVGRFPDDPVVLWWSGILREAEDEFVQAAGDRQYSLTKSFMESVVVMMGRR